MKKFSFLALAAVGLLLGACSSDKDVVDEGNSFETRGDRYVGIAIQLPNSTTPALTRGNDDYNDGDATEYAVKSGKLYLFKGATEGGATFLQAQDIINASTGWSADGSNYVTATKTAVAKIDQLTLTSSENLYAYVVLNYGGTSLATNPAVGTTFSTWSSTTLSAAQIGGTLNGAISDNGLLMTNAPIASNQGGSTAPSGATITTAVVLDKTKIKNTSTAAESDPAGCIFVERAAAKVTLTVSETATTIEMKDGADQKLKMDVSTLAWQIINTEKTFYNARQANVSEWLPYFNANGATNSKYRFVSKDLFSPTLPSPTGHTNSYRTYFAQDPQYSSNATLDKPQANDDKDAGGTDDFWLGEYAETKMKRAYVPENTFTTAMQTRTNTTQATVRVKFNDGADFYTISNDALYYTADAAKAKLATNIDADYNVDAKLTAACSDISHNKNSDVPVTATLTVAFTTSTAGVVTYTVTPSFAEGSDTWTVDDITDDVTKTNLTSAIASAIADYTLTLYKNGLSYYNVRIKHFGDKETPWEADGAYVTKPGTTTAQIYGSSDADKNFLGRYGIVRDNWYQLTISAIKKLGSATPPSVSGDGTPDDEIEEEYYISAHVHILPWVLRTQTVNL